MAKQVKIKIDVEGNAEEALKSIKKNYDDIKKSADDAKKATDGIGAPKEMPKQIPAPNQPNTPQQSQATLLKKQARIDRDEMVAMALAGDTSSAKFRQAEKSAGAYRDMLDEVNGRIKFMSSDTKAMDVGVDAIKGLGSAAQIAVGSMTLLGISNETAEQSIAKLAAIESILNGVKGLQLIMRKESVFMLGMESVKMKVLASTTALYSTVVGTSTGAMKAFKIALASTGIGLAVVAVGALISAFMNLSDSSAKASQAEEDRNKITNDGLTKTLENIKKNDEAYKKLRVELLRSQGKDKEADALEGSFKQNDINSLIIDAKNLNNAKKIYEDERIKSLEKIKNLETDITKITNIRTSFGQAEKANINEQIAKEKEHLKQINNYLGVIGTNITEKTGSILNLETEAEITKNNARNKTSIINSKNKPETVQASAPKNFTLNIAELGKIDQVNIMSDEDEKAFQQRFINLIMGAMTTAQARVSR